MTEISKTSMKRSKPSYFMAILGVALVLFILGMLGWITINASKLENYFKGSVQVHAFVRDGSPQKEIDVHKNVRLVEMPFPADMPDDLKKEYAAFLPLFEEVVKESIPDQTDNCALTIRITPGTRAIGASKQLRATARLQGYRRQSTNEYLAVLILYSYITGKLVDKEEIRRFLEIQILKPAACKSEG